jgi:hypothetical protein
VADSSCSSPTAPTPGVVDQHVDAAVPGEDPLDEGGALLGDDEVADLDLDAGRLGGELLERRRVAGDADDGVAEPGEAQGALAADAGGGAGEQDDPGTGGRRHDVGVPRTTRTNRTAPGGAGRRWTLRARGSGPRRPGPSHR